jgi:ribosomal protein S18 acetylase RimI-like enzyme
MRRRSLDGVPPPRACAPYALRDFRPGDEAGWLAVLAAAFPDKGWTPQKLREEFLGRPIWSPARVLLVTDAAGTPVACAAAWRHDWCEPDTGLLHWVATSPEHRGRGLARAVVRAALVRMHDAFGCRAAALVTQVHRIAAIRLYLSERFLPDMTCADDMDERWIRVAEGLRARPDASADGPVGGAP